MKVGIFGQSNNEVTLKYVQQLVELCREHKVSIVFEKNFFQSFGQLIEDESVETFSGYTDLDKDLDFFFSVGGDGTFLRSITFIRDLEIPVIGINTGRLGFLANIQKENISNAFQQIMNGEYSIQQRSVTRREN